VRLLLDEMISPRIARELRKSGHDVQAIKHDRPDLGGCPDRDLLRLMSEERRAIVTNDVDDFQIPHDRILAAAEEHGGVIFTFDASLPRRKDTIPMWVQALTDLLEQHPRDDALRNRVRYLV
jgi:predicted nuclease of predicted toxin-antitoxin system